MRKEPLSLVVAAIILILGVVLYLSFRIIFLKDLQVLGSRPSKLMQKDVSEDTSKKVLLKKLLLVEIQNYENRIQQNSMINDYRAESVKKVIILFLAIPLVALFITVCHFFVAV